MLVVVVVVVVARSVLTMLLTFSNPFCSCGQTQPTLASPGDMFMVPPDTTYQLINHSKKVTAFMYYTIVDFVAEEDDEAVAGETPADETPADETAADETAADETPADETAAGEGGEAQAPVAERVTQKNEEPEAKAGIAGDQGEIAAGSHAETSSVRVVAESNV